MKAAVYSGQPPLAIIFNDTSHDTWDEMDYKLFKAHYILEDWYRDGVPLWWDESDDVTFNAKARVSKSRAAIERAQDKEKKKVPGKYYVAEPVAMNGKDLPTRDDWIIAQAKKRS